MILSNSNYVNSWIWAIEFSQSRQKQKLLVNIYWHKGMDVNKV